MNIKIIDNFLDKEDFEKICSLDLAEINTNEIKVYVNEINNNKILKKEILDENFLTKLNNIYHEKTFKLLNELNPQKAKLYDYSTFTLIKTGSKYKFPFHDDTPNKLLSGVIYLYPKNNTGTIFYDNKKGDNKKIVEWKQNRGVSFFKS